MIGWKRCRCGGEMDGARQRLPDGRLTILWVCRKCSLAMEPGARRREWLCEAALLAGALLAVGLWARLFGLW